MKKALTAGRHNPERPISNIVVPLDPCSSPRNMQPWIVEYSGPLRKRLFIDPPAPSRSDPASGSTHNRTGTFLEIFPFCNVFVTG